MRWLRSSPVLFGVLLPILEIFPKTFPVFHKQAQILLCALCRRHVTIVGKVRFRIQDFVQLFITRLFLVREKLLSKQIIPLIVKIFRQVTKLREHFIRRVRRLDNVLLHTNKGIFLFLRLWLFFRFHRGFPPFLVLSLVYLRRFNFNKNLVVFKVISVK